MNKCLLTTGVCAAFVFASGLHAQSMGGMKHGSMKHGGMMQRVSGADQQAFDSVYDLLQADIASRQDMGMLYGSNGSSFGTAPVGGSGFPAAPVVDNGFPPVVDPSFPTDGGFPPVVDPSFPADGGFPPVVEPGFPADAGGFPPVVDPFAASDPNAPVQKTEGFPPVVDPFAASDPNFPAADPNFPPVVEPQVTAPQPTFPQPVDNPFVDETIVDANAPAGDLGFEDDFADLPEIEDEDFGTNRGFVGTLLSDLYIGAYGAATYAQSETQTFGTATFENSPELAYGGGALIGKPVGPLNIELEGHYSQTTTKSANSSDTVQVPNDVTTTRTSIIGLANAYYKQRFGAFGILAGGSVGYGQFKEETGTRVESVNGFAYGPLAGLTYQVSDQIELAAQYRYLIAQDLEFENEATQAITTKSIADHQAMIAVRYKF